MIVDLPWLETPRRRVAEALAAGRLPQGLLIVGRRGLGRHQLAQAIAAAALCARPGPDSQACGDCASCHQVQAGTHPDLLHLRVREDKTVILVEQIRELSRALSLSSGTHGLRCAIIHEAERMNPAAANALLKTLEEPRPGVSIILVTDRLAALPITIVSRCLQLPIAPPPQAQALNWLQQHERRQDWPLFLALSAGAPLAAVELAEEWPGSPGADISNLCAAAAGRSDPVAIAAQLKNLPPAVLAQLLAWLAHASMRLRFDTAESVPVEGLPALVSHADARALFRLWRAARKLSVDHASLNIELARERLILLFVDALHRRQPRSSQ
ncbi:MAG: DNA polymerase III subunit delta' [Gammaproteobacteria bacterium]